MTNLPEPAPGPGDVVVRPESVAICGSDLAAFRGEHPRMIPPLVLGHEFAGEIVAVGNEVSEGLLGRRVAVDPVVACGTCAACVAGRPNLCHSYRVLGCRSELPGAFADFVVVEAEKTWELPDSCSYVTGALIQPLAVSHHAVVDRAEVTPGEEVLVLGAGPVGLGALILARARGATVTVVDVDPFRLDLARRLGAERTLTGGEVPDWYTEGEGPRVVLECVGGRQDSTLEAALSWCRPGGRVVIVGNFAKGVSGVDPLAIKTKELDVLGSQAYCDSFGPLIEMIRTNQIDPEGMVSHVLALHAARDALEMLDDPGAKTGKVVMAADGKDRAESDVLLP